MRRITLLALAVLALGACSGGSSKGPDRTAVLADLSNRLMLPAYEELAARMTTLATAVDTLCATPGPTSVAAAQDAWREARQAWRATDSFRLGPATTRRLMASLGFPIDPAKVDELLDGDDPVTPEAVGALGADVRGLGGVEHVLFGPAPEGRRCEYAASASQLSAEAATKVADEWRTSFAAELADPASSGFLNEQAALDDVVNGMILAQANLADMRLAKASGATSGTPEPAAMDPGRAQFATAEAVATLASVQSVWGDEDRGVRTLVNPMSKDAASRVDAQLASAATALDGLPDPLADATDPALARAAYDRVREVLVTMRTEVASLLGVTLSLGDADGDS